MLAARLQSKVAAYLIDVPQWAYLQSRSTGDALLAVCAHLNQVRSLLSDHSSSLPCRFQGKQQPKMLGSISISLDIKKAFDSLSHAFLQDAMREAMFDDCEIQTVLFLHCQACLKVGKPEHNSKVFLGTGVRQGCSLSPLLWALATGRFFRLYQQALTQQQLPLGSTALFADDVFGSWIYRTPAAFKQAVRAIGVLVRTLQKIGLELSLDKTVILLASIGTSSPSVLASFKTLVDKIPHLNVPVGQTKIPFKIVPSHKYLGAMVSYQGFELLNLKHRLHTAWGSFWRLHHILINRTLSLRTRVRLWQACVFSVLRYSVHSVGLPPQGAAMITQAVHRQLRLIARSPAHLWHVTSEAILLRVKVANPWHTLSEQFQARADRPALLLRTSGVEAWLLRLQNTFAMKEASGKLSNPAQVTDSPTSPNPKPSVENIDPSGLDRRLHSFRQLTCRVCSQSFDSLGALRRHEAHAHKKDLSLTSSPQHGAAVDSSTPAHPPPRTQTITAGLHYAQSRRNVQVHARHTLLTDGLTTSLADADPQTRFVWLHSERGLCICGHCHRECGSWDDLNVHIFTKACPVLYPNAVDRAPVPFSTNALGTFWDSEIIAKTLHSWEAVADHLRHTKKDAHLYCPLCNQGLVKSKGLTQHIQAYHAWALSALNAARDHSLAHRNSLALTSPCWYCAATFKGHHSRHAVTCAMLLHAKFIVLLHHPAVLQDGSGRSFEGRLARSRRGTSLPSDSCSAGRSLLWTTADQPSPLPPGPSVAPSDHGGCTGSSGGIAAEVHTPQREGARPEPRQGNPSTSTATGSASDPASYTETPAATTARTTTTVPTPNVQPKPGAPTSQLTLRQLGFRGASDQSRAASAEARRLPDRPGTKHLLGDVSRNSSSPQHDSSPGPNQRAMATHQSREARVDPPPAPNSPVPDLGLGVEDTCGDSGSGPNPATGSSQAECPRRAGHVPLQKMEPHGPCSGDHPHTCPPHGTGSDPPARGSHCAQHAGVNLDQLPSYQEASTRNDGPDSYLLPGRRPPRPQSLPTVDHPRDPLGQCGVDACGHHIAERAPLQVPTGSICGAGAPPSVSRLHLDQVRQAALANPSNDCYANSTLLACVWTSLSYKPLEVCMKEQLHADLSACLSHLTGPTHIWSRTLWKRCLRHWPHCGRQQDAADFLTYLLQAAELRYFRGSWAVLSASSLRDSGQVCPVALTCDLSQVPKVRGLCPLQSVINHWHFSPTSPALTAGTECVVLQLNRFATEGRRLSKVTVAVSLPQQISLPVWVAGSVQRLKFRLCAALVHLGDTPKQGHYRALLVERSGRMWWTDDNRNALPPTSHDTRVILCNSYVLFFCPSHEVEH